MDCLTNYIGLKGCTDSDPISGMYINDLEGVNLESIEKLADSEQITYLKVWNDVQKRGLKKFSTAITNHLRTKYRIKNLLDRYYFGQHFDSSVIHPKEPSTVRGISIKLSPDREDAEISPFITMKITHLQLYSFTDADVEITISDGQSFEKYWSSTISVKAGKWNDVKASLTVPALAFSRELLITYDASKISTPKTSLSNDRESDGDGCSCGCQLTGCCSAEIRGIRTDALGAVQYDNSDTFGLRGFSSLQCSYEGLVCASREMFSVALWYFLGAELMSERMHSPRLNKFTTVNRDDARVLREDFLSTYMNEMQTMADSLDLNAENCCLECSAPLVYTEPLI